MKGNFEIGIALGIVLLLAALAVNIALQGLQGK
jgi:ABC-type tungstate transport system substrate-binding protein